MATIIQPPASTASIQDRAVEREANGPLSGASAPDTSDADYHPVWSQSGPSARPDAHASGPGGVARRPYGALTFAALSALALLDAAALGAALLSGLRDPLLIVLLSFCSHVAFAILITRLLILLFPIREGIFPSHSPESDRWRAQAAVALVSTHYLDPFVPFFFRTAWYRLFGARLGRGVLVGGHICDCSLTSMDEGAAVGADALLLGHWEARGRICIGRVQVGRQAMIGARALVFPGVAIGAGAVVRGLTLVPTGLAVAPNSDWPSPPSLRSTGLPAPDAGPGLARSSERKSGRPTGSGQRQNGSGPVSPSPVEDELRRYIETQILREGMPAQANGDDDPLAAALLDSVARIQLTLHLEKRHGIRLREEELSVEHFASVPTLARLIESKLGRPATAGQQLEAG